MNGTDLRDAPWRLWLWPYGVVGVVLITLLWLLLPGAGGAGWFWLPLALAYGAAVAWITLSPDARPPWR